MRLKPTDRKEFERRQLALEFGAACRFVNSLVVDVKKALTGFVKGLFTKAAPAAPYFHQLVLELDGIAQIPLFGA